MKKLWFKRKTYGYGWTPSTWEGWLVLGVYVLLLVIFVSKANFDKNSEGEIALNFFLYIFISTILLLVICFWKGEKPRWQWGPKKENEKNEKQ